MIAWKETKLRVRVVQARRVLCTHCDQPFVYLATDSFEKTVRGLPYASLVSGEEGRRSRLLEAVKDELESRSLQGKGQATCPHCRHQLPWMEIGRFQSVVGTALVFLVVGAVLTWILGALLAWTDASVIAIGAGVGAIAGGVLGGTMDLTPRTSEKADLDPYAMTDARWTEFTHTTHRARVEPAETWWRGVREETEVDTALVGMPFCDETAAS